MIVAARDVADIEKSPSWWRIVAHEFWRRRLNRLGLGIVIFLFTLALAAPLLANDWPLIAHWQGKTYFPVLGVVVPFRWFVSNPELQSLRPSQLKAESTYILSTPIPYSPTEYNLDDTLLPPSRKHWLGTDQEGRDILARLIHGARTSLAVGFIAVSLYVTIGIILGALAGYYGGRIDFILSRAIEVMMCFPTFFLILAILAFVGPSLVNIMIVIGLTGWTGIARLIRGEFLRLRGLEFVQASQALGLTAPRVIFRHILPNAMAPVMVSATFGVASAILAESSLSFLGFGVKPPTPSWGQILAQSQEFMDFAWWLTLFPGVAIFLTITAYNLVGEGLRDAIDPKMRKG